MNLFENKNECCICYDPFENSEYVSCCDNHKMCKSCFSDQVSSQISLESIGVFSENNCQIVCSICKSPFDDLTVALNTNNNIFNKFLKSKININVSKTMAEQEKIIKNKLQQSEAENHKNHICEKILTTCCPNCDTAFLDFDGCFAVECNNCRKSMCAWCMDYYSDDAHKHVANCRHALRKGVFGTTEDFITCQKIKKTKEVKKYLKKLEKNIRDQVVDLIQKDLDYLEICIDEKIKKNHNDSNSDKSDSDKSDSDESDSDESNSDGSDYYESDSDESDSDESDVDNNRKIFGLKDLYCTNKLATLK